MKYFRQNLNLFIFLLGTIWLCWWIFHNPAPDGFQNEYIHVGNAYDLETTKAVPTTFREAIEVFSNSDFVRRTLGEPVHDHYVHFYQNEQSEYENAVTDWERKRYFERI